MLQAIDLGFVRALSWISCTKYALIGTAQLEFKGVVTCNDTGAPSNLLLSNYTEMWLPFMVDCREFSEGHLIQTWDFALQ